MLTSFIYVFRHGRYMVVAVFVTISVVTMIALLPNLGLIERVLGASTVALDKRLWFVLQLYMSPFSTMSGFSATLSLLAAVLIGINSACLLFYIRRRRMPQRDRVAHAAGVGGIVSTLLGIGCAACGSAVLAAVASIVGATGLIVALPLHGAEFGLLGVGLLFLTTGFVLQRIGDSLVCQIDSRSATVK